MSWAEGVLRTRGLAVTIQRTPPVTTYVSLKRSSQSSDPAMRDAIWNGMALASPALVSGDLFMVGGDTYLVQSVVPDYASGQLLWYGVKCNATITHQRYNETYDDDGNLVQSWVTLGTSKAWGQIVTAKLRAEDPGLVDSARYLFQMPKSLGVQELDRIVYGGTNYRVEAVDDIAMPGVVRVQLGVDVR